MRETNMPAKLDKNAIYSKHSKRIYEACIHIYMRHIKSMTTFMWAEALYTYNDNESIFRLHKLSRASCQISQKSTWYFDFLDQSNFSASYVILHKVPY